MWYDHTSGILTLPFPIDRAAVNMVTRYHISEPNEYLVITGAGIQDVLIKKTALVLPWQKVSSHTAEIVASRYLQS